VRLPAIILGVALLSAFRASSAETIQIPNGSFESPATTFASPFIDSWQKTSKPDWYNDDGGTFQWTQLTGQFSNQPPSYIDNCDAKQAAWMFAVPEVGLFQDYDYPTNHAFNAIYEVGRKYRLTVGLMGGAGGGLLEGVTFELALYYRDAASNTVIVAATTVTNSSSVFSNHTHLVDFYADSAFVTSSDPWANQHIGVRLLSSITDTNLEGGYWDLDNVRLTATPAATLTNPAWTNGQLSFVIQSDPGLIFEIQKATNLESTPIWSSIGNITNDSGTNLFIDANATSGQSYYRAQLTR